MKRALLLILVLLAPSEAFSAYSLVDHTIAQTSDNSSVTTSNRVTTGASLLVVAVADLQSATPCTVSDSKSNSWAPLTTYERADGNIRIRFFYVANPTVGTGHIFSCNGAGGFPVIAEQAWAAALPVSPFDQQNGANTGSSATTYQPGSITPTLSNELIVAAIATDATWGSLSINSGFSISDSIDSGSSERLTMAYLIQGTAAAINPRWTSMNSVLNVADIASFTSALLPGSVTTLGVGR